MKKKSLLVFVFGLAVIFTVSACSVLSSVLPSKPKITEVPANILFSDDFSKTTSGWDQYSNDMGSSDYNNGAYEIIVNSTNYDIWANPGLTFTDVQVEVDATKVAGPENNDFGLICRYVDISNYYFAVVASDGYYGIGKYVDGTQEILGGSMPVTDKVNPGSVPNHLRFDCIGSKLSLYANGNLLGEYEDSAFTSGDVGLMAGTFDEIGTDVSFDNFLVTKP